MNHRRPYQIDSDPINELVARNISPIVVQTIDLSVAGFRSIKMPGYSFVGYFFQTGTANKVRSPGGLVQVVINRDDTGPKFPAKHNRGFRGPFYQLDLTWAAQAGVSVDFCVHTSRHTPWMSDDIETSSTPVASGALVGIGSPGAPVVINPAIALIPTADQRQIWYVVSSGGIAPVTAIPQIAPGTVLNQELILTGCSDVDFIVFHDGDGLMLNGPENLTNGASIYLVWDGTEWREISRR